MLHSYDFLPLTDLAIDDVKMVDGVENVQQNLLLAAVAFSEEGFRLHWDEVGCVPPGGVGVEDVGA